MRDGATSSWTSPFGRIEVPVARRYPIAPRLSWNKRGTIVLCAQSGRRRGGACQPKKE